MKTLFAIVAVAALFIAGCLQGGGDSDKLLDCKDNLECFKQQVKTSCGPAKVNIERLGVTIYAEVSPKEEEGNCNVFIQLKDIKLPATASEEDKQSLEQTRPLFALATMDCAVEKKDASDLDDPAFLSSEKTLGKCEGLLKDEILRRIKLFTQKTVPTPAYTPTPTYAPTATPATTQPTATPAATAGATSTPSPSATPSPSPTSTTTPSPSPTSTATPSPSPTSTATTPTPPPGLHQLSEAVPGGGALAYYAPTQMLLVGGVNGGISVYRLNSTNVDRGLYLFPRIATALSGGASLVVNDMKFSADNEFLYASTRSGFLVMRFSPNGTITGPLSNVSANDTYGSIDAEVSGNFVYVRFLHSLKKIDVSNASNPIVVAELPLTGSLKSFAVKDGSLLVSSTSADWPYESSLSVYSPSLQQTANFSATRLNRSTVGKMAVEGNNIYAIGGQGILVLDASNLSNISVCAGAAFNYTYPSALGAIAVTPTRIYVSGSWYNQGQGRNFGVIGYADKANPQAFQLYSASRADGVYADLVVDENNPYFYGGVAVLHGRYRGSVMHIGLLPIPYQQT